MEDLDKGRPVAFGCGVSRQEPWCLGPESGTTAQALRPNPAQ